MVALNCLSYEVAHPLGRFLLHFVGDMGIGIQGEARRVVAQDAGDRLCVHALLDCQGCEGVPQAVKGDVFRDSGLVDLFLPQILEGVFCQMMG